MAVFQKHNLEWPQLLWKSFSQVMSSNTHSVLISSLGSEHVKGCTESHNCLGKQESGHSWYGGAFLSSRIFCVSVLCTFKSSTKLGIPVLGSRKAYQLPATFWSGLNVLIDSLRVWIFFFSVRLCRVQIVHVLMCLDVAFSGLDLHPVHWYWKSKLNGSVC